jgi:hypothetical protein
MEKYLLETLLNSDLAINDPNMAPNGMMPTSIPSAIELSIDMP